MTERRIKIKRNTTYQSPIEQEYFSMDGVSFLHEGSKRPTGPTENKPEKDDLQPDRDQHENPTKTPPRPFPTEYLHG